MPGFISIHFNARDIADGNHARLKSMVRGTAGSANVFKSTASSPDFAAPDGGQAASIGKEAPEVRSDEVSSRLALQTFLEDAGSDALTAATSPDRAELVPDLQLTGASAAPNMEARSVAFQQSAHAIPIFGGRVVVDIDALDKTLISINGKVSAPPDADALAQVSPADAWAALGDWAGARGTALGTAPPVPPVLTWYHDDEKDRWRLVYQFVSIPLAPPEEALPSDLPFALAASPACVHQCRRSAYYDYFVDAQDRSVCFYFSSAAGLDLPAPMRGIDCFALPREFYGLRGSGGYLMVDPLRNLETYDYAGADIDKQPTPPLPAQAITSATHDLGNARPEAVSAHYHARLVYDFYNDVLKRDGVDDKGMKLISVVNVYSSDRNPLPTPQWGNAVWWNGKMWYGSEAGTSFAKYLDIIGHELTHGVTETSSKLIYRRLAGALNESFSDIFGVIIANWLPGQPNPVSTWNWEIGAGLGANGGPIRNFAQPALVGQPDHMDKYRELPISYDNGGVHIYSGIHNRAVHHLMTAEAADGSAAFPMQELVLILYYTLTRLTPLSQFIDSRRTLENVVGSYYADEADTMAVRLKVIADAFDMVGIQ
jgi:bacillolysin